MALWYRPIYPGTQWFKALGVSIILRVMGRALQAVSTRDSDIRNGIRSWNEGFTIRVKILPQGSTIGWQKKGRRLVCLGSSLHRADLEMNFRNLESAWLVLWPHMGLFQALAENRIHFSGTIVHAMSFVRVLSALMASLYPWFMLQSWGDRLPKSTLRRAGMRLWLYSFGILLGR